MATILFAFILYCIAFALHLIIWHIRLPQQHTRGLMLIFFGTLSVGLILAWWPSFFQLGPTTIWEYVSVVLFHSVLSLAYIAFYSAIEEDSPSLLLVNAVALSGDKGMDQASCQQLIGDDFLLNRRLELMLRDKWVVKQEDRYILAPKGVKMVAVFVVVARAIGLPQGG